MDFRIIDIQTREDVPSIYLVGEREKIVGYLKRLEEKYQVTLPPITHVVMGDAGTPLDVIHFKGGLQLYNEGYGHQSNLKEMEILQRKKRQQEFIQKELAKWHKI